MSNLSGKAIRYTFNMSFSILIQNLNHICCRKGWFYMSSTDLGQSFRQLNLGDIFQFKCDSGQIFSFYRGAKHILEHLLD